MLHYYKRKLIGSNVGTYLWFSSFKHALVFAEHKKINTVDSTKKLWWSEPILILCRILFQFFMNENKLDCKPSWIASLRNCLEFARIVHFIDVDVDRNSGNSLFLLSSSGCECTRLNCDTGPFLDRAWFTELVLLLKRFTLLIAFVKVKHTPISNRSQQMCPDTLLGILMRHNS